MAQMAATKVAVGLLVACGTFVQALAPVPASAQDVDSLRSAWVLELPQRHPSPARDIRMVPGSSIYSPTAFGADWGIVYATAGYQHRARNALRSDGAVTVGAGFGNADKWVGLDASVLSLGTLRSFGRFSFSFQAHRRLPGNSAVAVGVEHAGVVGYTDSRKSTYGVATKRLDLDESSRGLLDALTVSVGIGNGRFVSEKDWYAKEFDKVNLFGSVGVDVAEPLALVADWTGQDLVIGASLVPFKSVPLVIAPAVADVTGSAGDGARFVLAVGVGSYVPTLFSRR